MHLIHRLRYSASVTGGGADTTAPVLSVAVGNQTGATTATVGSTTDEGNGTLYVSVSTSATQPSVAQIKAGQTNTGSAATYASSQAISSTGAKTFSATGLTTGTPYYAHMVHTDAATNDSNRLSSSSFTPATSGVFFNPGDLGTFANPLAIFTVDVNNHDSGTTELVTPATAGISASPAASSKIIQINYPNDEAGTQLQFPNFSATQTLYYRWYMMLSSEFSGHFPVGLKISRTFTKNDYTATVGESGVDGDAYASPKLWMKYADPETGFNPDYPVGGDPNSTNVWGTCTATMNLDIGAAFSGAVNFNNGLPYVRAGYWYLIEMAQTMNSADGVADGSFQIRIDGDVVYNNTAVRWVQSGSPRYVVNGLGGWQSMWFGGNVSYGDFSFPTGTTPKRYEDGYYVSTTEDWL